MKRDESGFSLIEVLIGLILFIVIALAFYAALTTALRTVLLTQERTMAESLARSQMEYIRDATYDENGYTPPIPQEYADAGYSAEISAPVVAENVTANMSVQKITIDIYHPYDENLVITLEDYKAK